MTDTLNLLPCAHCGSADVHFSSPGAPDEQSYDFVICNGCGISAGRADCLGDLIETWNRRASPPAAVKVAGLGRITNEDNGYLTLQFKDEEAACQFARDHTPSVEVDEMPAVTAAAVPDTQADDTYCSVLVREAGLPAARRCPTCGMGPCKKVATPAVPEGALPPLPEPDRQSAVTGDRWHSAEAMQAYARAAVEADRAQRPENTDYATALKHIKSMAAAGHSHDAIYEQACSALEAADRAQQGEPVGRAALMEFIDKYCLGNSELVACAESAFYWFNKVATKAAAPADAPIQEMPLLGGGMLRRGPRDGGGHLWLMYSTGGKLIRALSSPEQQLIETALAARAAPVPDTGIPTAGEVSIDTPEFREVLDDFAYWASERRAMGGDFGSAEAEEKAEAALIAYIDNFRAPVSSTPTPGEVEKINMAQAGVGDHGRGYCQGWNDCVDAHAAPSHPSEAKAGEKP